MPNDANEVETQMDTPSTDILSHGQQEPQTEDNPFVDSIQEGDNIQEDSKEVFTEVARIIEDLENGIVDQTLARVETLHWIWMIYLYMRMMIGQIAQVKEVWMEWKKRVSYICSRKRAISKNFH